jgi:hypothetical protein
LPNKSPFAVRAPLNSSAGPLKLHSNDRVTSNTRRSHGARAGIERTTCPKSFQ